MKPETFNEAIEQLEASGWQADNTPRAVEKEYTFESYSDTLNFLIELGAVAEKHDAMPAIRIKDGNQLHLRIGQPPAPVLSAGEIELAQALAAGSPAPPTEQEIRDDDRDPSRVSASHVPRPGPTRPVGTVVKDPAQRPRARRLVLHPAPGSAVGRQLPPYP